MAIERGKHADTGLVRASAAALGVSVLVASIVHGFRLLIWVSQFSFPTNDQSWLGGDRFTEPVLGAHHFGDWQEVVSWADRPNPYLTPELGTHVLPPILLAVKAVAGLPIVWSWLALASLSAALTFAATWLLMDGFRPLSRIAAWVVFFAGSAGLVSALDRGSLTALAIGLIGMWLAALRGNRPILGALALALAVSTKPYLAILLLWPLLQRQWRHLGSAVGLMVASVMACFAVLPGPLADSLLGYIETSRLYSGPGLKPEIFLRADSLFGLVVHPVLLVNEDWTLAYVWATTFPTWFYLLPGVVWLGIVVHVCTRRTVAVSLQLCLVLSLIQFALPTSQTYTACWVGLAALVLTSERRRPGEPRTPRRAIQGATLLSVVPIPLTFGGLPGTPWACLVCPLAWLIAGIVCAMQMPTDGESNSPENNDEVPPGGPASASIVTTSVSEREPLHRPSGDGTRRAGPASCMRSWTMPPRFGGAAGRQPAVQRGVDERFQILAVDNFASTWNWDLPGHELGSRKRLLRVERTSARMRRCRASSASVTADPLRAIARRSRPSNLRVVRPPASSMLMCHGSMTQAVSR